MKYLIWTGLLALMLPGALEAQEEAKQEPLSEGITLVYEREVYTYRGDNRRDPFRPLTGANEMGPRFDDLSLRGIIYSTGRGRSVALIADSEDRVYRTRVGDMIGNARIIEISPARVVVAVQNFGSIRQEILEMPTRGGSER